MKPRVLVVLCVLGLTSVSPVQARMYQWVNPTTGSTQLAGSPPAWYRSGLTGPRVLVFENGVLVDDTSLRLSAEQETRLREQATSEEEARELAALRRLEELNRQAESAQAKVDETPGEEALGLEPAEAQPEPEEEITPDLISRMKALIQQFDRDQGLLAR